MLEDGGQTFLRFAQTQGVVIDSGRLEADGRIHRADVGDESSGRNDAAYLLREDGSGWVVNFKAEGKPIYYKPELARELTPEEQARAEASRQATREAQAQRQREALQEAVTRWEEARPPQDFPYLKLPKLDAAGLRQGRAQLLVPMMAIDADGEPGWVGMQRITWAEPGQSADKRFVSGTPTKGAFAVIPIDGGDVEAPLRAYEAARIAPQVVLCEGIGTALAIHQTTGLPVIAALSAQNLPDVARDLRDKLQGKAVIYADNDGERAAFKGQAYALRAARILGEARTAIVLPEKPGGITPPGYDARDQLRDGGAALIQAALKTAMRPAAFERHIPEQYRPQFTRPPRHAAQPPHQEKTMEHTPKQARAAEIDDTPMETQVGMTAVPTADHSELVAKFPHVMQGAQQEKQATTIEASADAQFAALNQAADAVDRSSQTMPLAVGPQQSAAVLPRLAQQAEEARLLQAWRESAQPVREARAKALSDLAHRQQAEREKLFSGLDQVRSDKAKELSGVDPERREHLVAFEVAKQVEHLQKQQAADRKTLLSELPNVPSLVNFLEQRADADPAAAHMLEQEKRRDQAPDAFHGRRIAPLEPEVLEGLTHEFEDEPEKAVHYARDGERVMSDRGARVDLYKMDDREIEAALRLAEQKYDMDKGLQLTGSREFQERAAELAGRLGLKVQNPDLQQTWQHGRLQTMQGAEVGEDVRLTAPAKGLGAIGPATAAHTPQGDSRRYSVDQSRMVSEAVLANLDIEAQNALDRAGRYELLNPDERITLTSGEKPLIDDKDRLTPLGAQVYQRMWEKIDAEREQLQQQLRARNVDEDMEKRKHQELAHEKAEEKSAEKTAERVQEQTEVRQVEQPQRIPQRARPKARDQGVGLG